jgi:hypothetical protein
MAQNDFLPAEPPHPTLIIAMVAAAVLALFLAMYLAWISFSRRPIRRIDDRGGRIKNGEEEGFVDPPASTSSSHASVGVAEWTAVQPESAPRPLLDLALQREAAKRGPDFRVGLRGRGLAVTGAWKEKTTDAPVSRGDDGGQRPSAPPDLWHRWTVEACFFRVDDAFGACESLDVRARSAWTSSTPPTEWPVEILRVPTDSAKQPVPTSELI